MAGWTNRGKMQALKHLFDATALPANYYLYLVTTVPTDDTNTLSDLTEASNCDGEETITDADFNVPTEDDANNWGTVTMTDQVFAASGGPMTCKAAVLTDANGTEGNRIVYCYWNLNSGNDVTVSDGQTLTLSGLTIRFTET